MKTKIVYVLATSEEQIYLEQLTVSAWSMRYHNPEAHIVLVCDQDTRPLLDKGWQKEYASLFNEIKVCHYDPEQSIMERSREMKTSLRSIVTGDFLFLDVDTIVCDKLDFIDDFPFELGMALDHNCTFDKYLARSWVISQMEQCFNMDISKEKKYFNSGVIFAKDTDMVRRFYGAWHKNWRYEVENTDFMQDQQPLVKTNIDMGYVITEMSGIMNCQIVVSMRHLHNAAIVHIFNNHRGKDTAVSPFHSLSTYGEIRENGFSDEWKHKVIHFKEMFSSPSTILGESNSLLWREITADGRIDVLDSYTVKLIMRIRFSYPSVFCMIERILGAIHKSKAYFKKSQQTNKQ